MRFSAFRRAAVCLAATLIVGGAWAFHAAVSAHDAADNDCQVCAAACSPELNSDCGAELVARPENFNFVVPTSPWRPVQSGAVLTSRSRAPPAV